MTDRGGRASEPGLRRAREPGLRSARARAQADTDEGQAACDRLGVDVLPTLQFWRDGAKLWEHRGIIELDQDLAEGARGGPCAGCRTCTCAWVCLDLCG